MHGYSVAAVINIANGNPANKVKHRPRENISFKYNGV